MEGPFNLNPGYKARTPERRGHIERLTTLEKMELHENLNAIMHLFEMSRPTIASLLTMEVLLPKIKLILNKINLSARVDEVMEALNKDLKDMKES